MSGPSDRSVEHDVAACGLARLHRVTGFSGRSVQGHQNANTNPPLSNAWMDVGNRMRGLWRYHRHTNHGRQAATTWNNMVATESERYSSGKLHEMGPAAMCASIRFARRMVMPLCMARSRTSGEYSLISNPTSRPQRSISSGSPPTFVPSCGEVRNRFASLRATRVASVRLRETGRLGQPDGAHRPGAIDEEEIPGSRSRLTRRTAGSCRDAGRSVERHGQTVNRDGIGKSSFRMQCLRVRASDMDPVHASPYRPAAGDVPQ